VTRSLDEIRLEPSEFRLLCDVIKAHAGLHFGPEARPLLERKLRERLSVHHLRSFNDYYRRFFEQGGKVELEEAIELIAIHETYFFREDYQLKALKNEILPALTTGPSARPRVTIWSAGCSTGEEVYSIAIAVRESTLAFGREIRVIGSDISRRCLKTAREGIYGSSAFRATPQEIRDRHFMDRADGMHVADYIRALCSFAHLNLLDTPRTAIVGRVDVIFCRNVLIYFDDASRRRVIETFYERLNPGGFLLLGHSESLLNVSTAFELVHLREDLVYRKPLTATQREPTSTYEMLDDVRSVP
jgi:chemotaxis protein methyltransferase CheR